MQKNQLPILRKIKILKNMLKNKKLTLKQTLNKKYRIKNSKLKRKNNQRINRRVQVHHKRQIKQIKKLIK